MSSLFKDFINISYKMQKTWVTDRAGNRIENYPYSALTHIVHLRTLYSVSVVQYNLRVFSSTIYIVSCNKVSIIFQKSNSLLILRSFNHIEMFCCSSLF